MKNTTHLIKAIALNQKSLDALIDASIKQAEIFGKKTSNVISREEMKKIVTSDLVLEPFAKKFDEIFTSKEVDDLLSIYQSTLMKKLLNHSSQLFDPLYFAFHKKIESSL